MDGWNASFLRDGLFSGAMFVSKSVVSLERINVAIYESQCMFFFGIYYTLIFC